jgi:hypothetical protein
MWMSVAYALSKGACDSQHDILDQAVERMNDGKFKTILLPYCNARQGEAILPKLMSLSMLESVAETLKICIRETQQDRFVEQAAETVCDEDFKLILPHCSVRQKEAVLPKLLSRHLWKSVYETLKGGVCNVS